MGVMQGEVLSLCQLVVCRPHRVKDMPPVITQSKVSQVLYLHNEITRVTTHKRAFARREWQIKLRQRESPRSEKSATRKQLCVAFIRESRPFYNGGGNEGQVVIVNLPIVKFPKEFYVNTINLNCG